MRGKSILSCTLICALGLSSLLTMQGNACSQAAFPFSDGFESGLLGPEWSVGADPNSHIEVTGLYSPHGGDWHVAMDTLVSGNYALNTLDLAIDLSGLDNVELTYWYKEYGDEDHAEDGCFVSDDGVNFFLVNSHNNGPTSWTEFRVDIDAAALQFGLQLNANFVIRFQHYDNSALTSDGICIDDVAVDLAQLPSLMCDVTSLSAAAGGQAIFYLHAGTDYGGREYVLLGTASGTTPGQTLPGGAILPLNPGHFFRCVRLRLNSWYFVQFRYYLDANGSAAAMMDSLGVIDPLLIGRHLDFAFTTTWPFDFQSATVGIDITA